VPTSRFERFLPIAGVLAGLLFALSYVLTWNAPSPESDAADVVGWYSDHVGAASVAGFALGYFMVVMLLFATGLRQALRSGEAGESTYSTAAFAGAVLVALSAALTGLGYLAAASAADKGVTGAVDAIGFLADFSWVPWVASAAVMFLAAGLGGLRTAALPKWLSIVSIVLGVLCLTGPTGIAVYLVSPLWMIATGVVLGRRQSRVALPSPRQTSVDVSREPVGQTW
jgi:hypothetical protein